MTPTQNPTTSAIPTVPTVPHWIAGAANAGTSGRTADVYDPATGQVTKRVALASRDDADAVIAAAAAAWPAWRDISLARRTQVLFSFRELLNARKGELAEIITAEHGKVLDDALGEVSRGQEIVGLQTDQPYTHGLHTLPSIAATAADPHRPFSAAA